MADAQLTTGLRQLWAVSENYPELKANESFNKIHDELVGTENKIAFARQHGSLDGQIFALAVMAVAASEVVVGLGLVVAMARRNVALDTDRLTTLRG